MQRLLLLIFISGLTIISACKKAINDLPGGQPVPNHADTSSFVQFSVPGITLTGSQLYALISIETKSGIQVLVNKKVTLDYIQGTYKTDKVAITKGEFKLSKFIVLTTKDTAVYAVPRVNSTMASKVTNPLAIGVVISTSGIKDIAVQVLPIKETDMPESFGYDAGDFGFISFIAVNAKLKISVGVVEYDSLMGTLRVIALNNQGEQWSREIEIQPGATSVRIPENYSNYRFEMKKWNVTVTKTFVHGEIQPGMTISLEGFRQPKRLAKEETFIENSGGLIPDTRTEYFYNSNNLLVQIKNYQRSLQVSGLHLSNVHQFKYVGTSIDSIYRFDSVYNQTGYTAFFYEGNNISNIASQSYDQFTGAAVTHTSSGAYKIIQADYVFSNGQSMTYKLWLLHGNKVSDQAISSAGGGESGTYEYDNNINPKHQLGYPDIYFSNSSKNNLTREQKVYGGAIPQVIPYKFEYTYDLDGYPVELYISYKGYSSQQHLYRIRKTYKYL